MNDMSKNNIEYVIMEVSAHAIAQNRIEALHFECLVYTNCTQDHLDYFENMQNYEQTKFSIFQKDVASNYVINSDDNLGQKIINFLPNCISYGINNPADVFAINIEENNDGLNFIINLFDSIFAVKSKLYARYNVYNIMASCAVCGILGLSVASIIKSANEILPISGRCQKIAEINGGQVFLDYAHTPDGLEKTIESIKALGGRVVCLFGCGGDRDKTKRQIMGQIAGRLSNFVVITSDNPRSENAFDIINDIEQGIIKVSHNYIKICNRKHAIIYALNCIDPNDKLIIAGKGCETYQEIMGERFHFSDAELVNDYIEKKGMSF